MSVFLESVDMNREEFLEMLLENYLYTRSNHKNTLLGIPYEVAVVEGRLNGACMALGISYRVEHRKYIFYTNKKQKIIFEMQMGDYYDQIQHLKAVSDKEVSEFKKIL